jgi:methyl-accepting chemotaxis protein
MIHGAYFCTISGVNPLLLPPRLIVRALDDLHALSRSAEVVSRTLSTLGPERVDEALANLAALADAAERLPQIEGALADTEQEALRRVDSLDKRLANLLELAGGIERGLPAIGEVLERIAALDERLGGALELVGRLESDLASLGRIAPSVDVLTEAAGRLADTVEPLQGTAERLGRIADRLPGARGRG